MTKYNSVLKIGSSLYVAIPVALRKGLGIEEGDSIKFTWSEDFETIRVEKAV